MTAAKDRILSAAVRQQLREGAEGLSMRGIASDVGVTATSIYRHFRDKADLLEAIVEMGFASLMQYFQRRRKKPSVLEIMDRFLAFALEQPRLYELMFLRERKGVRKFPADFAAHRSPTFDLLRDAVEREMAARKMRRDDSLETALTIWSHGHGLISMYTLGRFGNDAGAFVGIFKRSTRRIYRGLASPTRRRSNV